MAARFRTAPVASVLAPRTVGALDRAGMLRLNTPTGCCGPQQRCRTLVASLRVARRWSVIQCDDGSRRGTVARIDVFAAAELPRVSIQLDGSSTRKEIHDEYDRRDDEQDVDEVAADSTDDSEQPQNEDDHENCPKHDDFSFAECVRDSTRTRLFFPISIS